MALLYFLWDASAIVKRYVPEIGSDVVDALFTIVPAPQHILTVPGYAETFAILLRKKNGGVISPATFAAKISTLQTDFLANTNTLLLTVTDAVIFGSLARIQQHDLNSSDAAILSAFAPYNSNQSLFIAADKRLIRAAQAEGFLSLDPEQIQAVNVPAFLAIR